MGQVAYQIIDEVHVVCIKAKPLAVWELCLHLQNYMTEVCIILGQWPEVPKERTGSLMQITVRLGRCYKALRSIRSFGMTIVAVVDQLSAIHPNSFEMASGCRRALQYKQRSAWPVAAWRKT